MFSVKEDWQMGTCLSGAMVFVSMNDVHYITATCMCPVG
jgi:hypothetical protein